MVRQVTATTPEWPFAGLTPPYGTIVADPPWRYRMSEQAAPIKHSRRTAEDCYPTLWMREIAALPVADLAAENAHLYLWVTNPRLSGERACRADEWNPFKIIEAWGFNYATMLTWVKPIGLGHYFRGATEHILFATRGVARIPPEKRESNVIVAPRGGHSEKPQALLDLVERVSPGPYVELFARQPRLGWDHWGKP